MSDIHEEGSAEAESASPKGVWCLVANVAAEQVYGESHEIRSGTKHFSANTKVYCFPGQWGDGYEKIKVIAHHRGSPKLITMVMPSKRLTNWRVKVVYKPYVIREMGDVWTQENAESYVKWLQFREKVEQAQRVGLDTIAPNEALLYAVYLGKIDEVRHALERGADVNMRDSDERVPLLIAVGSDKIDLVTLLVEHGANVNMYGSDKRTPLLVAIALHKDDKIITLLVEHGADKKATTSSGKNVKTIVEESWYWKMPRRRAFLESLGFDLSTEPD